MTAFPRLFTRYSPLDQDAGGQMTAPSRAHIMGTDNLSRDVWARVVYGAQTILGVAIAAALLSAFIGIPLGLLSGFRRRHLRQGPLPRHGLRVFLPGPDPRHRLRRHAGAGGDQHHPRGGGGLHSHLLPPGARPDPVHQGRALRGGGPGHRRPTPDHPQPLHLPQRHRHRGRRSSP